MESIPLPLRMESLAVLGHFERAKQVAQVGLEVKFKAQNIQGVLHCQNRTSEDCHIRKDGKVAGW